MTENASAPGLPLGAPVDDAPAAQPGPVTLEGRHVRIVPFDADRHGGDLFALSHGPEKERLWAYLRPEPFPDATAFARFYAAAAAAGDQALYTVATVDAGRAVGHAAYLRITPAYRTIEVGNILYTPQLQRTPGATEAMYLMARHAFEDLGYRRYEWKCDSLNAPSRRAAERFGFTYEGLFRQHMILKGRNRDTAWFSLLDAEWPRAKAAFEIWLDPSNFDADGRQRRRLEEIRAGL